MGPIGKLRNYFSSILVGLGCEKGHEIAGVREPLLAILEYDPAVEDICHSIEVDQHVMLSGQGGLLWHIMKGLVMEHDYIIIEVGRGGRESELLAYLTQ